MYTDQTTYDLVEQRPNQLVPRHAVQTRQGPGRHTMDRSIARACLAERCTAKCLFVECCISPDTYHHAIVEWDTVSYGSSHGAAVSLPAPALLRELDCSQINSCTWVPHAVLNFNIY
jgi:hypothetical protein